MICCSKDSHVIHDWEEETAYTRVMGHMDVVSIVSDAFNIYFPILLLILTLATYFSLGSRLLSFLGFQQFLEEAGHTGCESGVLVLDTNGSLNVLTLSSPNCKF